MAMEGNGRDQENVDEAPIVRHGFSHVAHGPTNPGLQRRPVSSLLSHFENLSHRKTQSTVDGSNDITQQFLRAPEAGDDHRSPSRASLDLPRPRSPWNTTADERQGRQNGQVNSEQLRSHESPGARYGRPISMNFKQSSPQLAPTLTVHSPQSPPRSLERELHAAQQDDNRMARPSVHRARESVSAGPAASRPVTPQHGSSVGDTIARLSPNALGLNGSGTQSERKLKSASLPPPVNRADKPKIPAKPAMFSHPDSSSLAPRPAPASSERPVSPFSTPPSSPEKPPTKPVSAGKIRRSPPRLTPELPSRRSFDERSPALSAYARRDAREIGFSRTRPAPEPSRATKPLMVQIPPNSSAPQESSTAPPLSAQRPRPSENLYDRPGLPPRPAAAPYRRSGVSPVRESPQLVTSPANMTPVARSAPSFPPINETTDQRHIQRQQSSSRESQLPSAYQERRMARTDTEEEEQPIDEPAIARTDYPDASKANRRPPLLKSGPKEILTRYDTRLLDVCGKYVCTTGYLTRVWDLTTGEQVLSISHGETVKSLSLAFKPGKDLEDEGQSLWLGTSAGELHEVNIASQSIVASRSYPSRREVIQILRHKKEMWTIDDEGRLLVWPPDETGVPSLQYSYHSPPERVARGQFSMVVDDKLWLAAGKDVYIYRPSTRDDSSFKVFKRPLGLQHTGDVTCGTYTSHDGGRVYLGHADGKLTVYSSSDYSCLAVVNVSVYKINCLGFVGDYLWAGYKTGMIYVYDTKTDPWTVKKDWRAHDSPVCGFVLDTSSVWTISRLQVTSLGTDNCIRLWDGMLEDDWLGMLVTWYQLIIGSNIVQMLVCKAETWNTVNSGKFALLLLHGTPVLQHLAACARLISSEMPSNRRTRLIL